MNKLLKICIYILFVSYFIYFLFPEKVSAANSWSWTVDGERISIGSSNKSGTASWSSDDNYSGGILTLNNYNGGQISIDNYGSMNGIPDFTIKLIGDNTITVSDGVGLAANANIVFIGDGKLTINAVTPIGHDSRIYHGEYKTTVVINNNSSSSENNDVVNKEDDIINDSENNNDFFDNNIFKIILLSYCFICTIIIIVFIIKKILKIKN